MGCFAVQESQAQQQPGLLDRAKAYVPSLHSSGHSQQAEGYPSSPQSAHTTAAMNTQSGEPEPSLLDKAKAYIPVLGGATEFDPAAESRHEAGLGQRVTQAGYGTEAEDQSHESLLDKAKAYMPTMGAPGTTAAGNNVSASFTLTLARMYRTHISWHKRKA